MPTFQEVKDQIAQSAGVLAVTAKHVDTPGGVRVYDLTVIEEAGDVARTTVVRYAVTDEYAPAEQARPVGRQWQPYEAPTPDDLSQPVRDYLDGPQGLPELRAYQITHLDLVRREAVVEGIEVVDATQAERRSYLIWKPDGQPIQRRRVV